MNSIMGGMGGSAPRFGNEHQTYLRLGHYSAGLGHYSAGFSRARALFSRASEAQPRVYSVLVFFTEKILLI